MIECAFGLPLSLPYFSPLTLPLGWRPFLDPMPADHAWFWLAIPLVLAVSMVYKAVRGAEIRSIPKETALLAGQILLVLLVAAWVVGLLADHL